MNEARFIIFLSRMCHRRNKILERDLQDKQRLINSGMSADLQVAANLPQLTASHSPSLFFIKAVDEAVKLASRADIQDGSRGWRLPDAIPASEAHRKVFSALSKEPRQERLHKLSAALLSCFLTSQGESPPSKPGPGQYKEYKQRLLEIMMAAVE